MAKIKIADLDYTKITESGFEKRILYRKKNYKFLNTLGSVSSDKKTLESHIKKLMNNCLLGGPRKEIVFPEQYYSLKSAIIKKNIFGTSYGIYIPD